MSFGTLGLKLNETFSLLQRRCQECTVMRESMSAKEAKMTAYGANCENGLFLRSAAVFNIALGAKPAMQDEPCKGTRELNHSQGNGQENGPKSLVSLFAKAFGPNHPQAAKMLHKQARFYHKLKKYTEAEALYQQSLAIAEKVFSERDTELASILNNLARLYQDQNRHEEATPLYQRSLAIVEGTFGSVHPKVARRLHNLVALYQAQ